MNINGTSPPPSFVSSFTDPTLAALELLAHTAGEDRSLRRESQRLAEEARQRLADAEVDAMRDGAGHMLNGALGASAMLAGSAALTAASAGASTGSTQSTESPEPTPTPEAASGTPPEACEAPEPKAEPNGGDKLLQKSPCLLESGAQIATQLGQAGAKAEEADAKAAQSNAETARNRQAMEAEAAEAAQDRADKAFDAIAMVERAQNEANLAIIRG